MTKAIINDSDKNRVYDNGVDNYRRVLWWSFASDQNISDNSKYSKTADL